MSTERYDYPEDEFDVAGRERGPQGAHRTPRPLWRTLLPFLVVIVAAPLLAWGAVSLLGGGDDEPAPQATTTQEATDDAGDGGGDENGGGADDGGETSNEEEATEGETEETTEPGADETTEDATEEVAVAADLTATISVLNGAGISGLAGQTAESLMDEGFSQVSAGNYGAAAPQTTTLYYNNATLEPTAQAIGEALGITELVEAPGATTNVDIAIVLRGDFSG